MTAVLLTIGDEILLGQIVDTNAAWLGERLAASGVDLVRHETVRDTMPAIRAALERAFAPGEGGGVGLVVATGGLGPTTDDLTREAVAAHFGVGVRQDWGIEDRLRALFAARGREMQPVVLRMAGVPEGFTVLDNPVGTAPGLWGERAGPHGTERVALLPGVPREMSAIWDSSLRAQVDALAGGAVVSRTLVTAGYGETDLAARHGDLADVLVSDARADVGIAYLPGLGTVRLRVTARGPDAAAASARVDRVVDRLSERLGDAVFGEGADTLEGVVLDGLVACGLTIATAESCTGGSIAARLTSVPGASRAFMGGVVAYDNRIKTGLLGVSVALLREHGAVSEPVVRAMAEGARTHLGADVGVATSGVAGPGGGTPEKPVGTVWLAVSWPDGEGGARTEAVRLQFSHDRGVTIGLSTVSALNLVRRRVLGQ
ncbi:MAG TPA: CinA family nicotinamide mononucleotide deamidase-related protein [Rubricoccaceae bacterium]|jgi:nicotinamide-nucleotide amidase